MLARSCLHCGVKFDVVAMRDFPRKFCSEECRQAERQPQPSEIRRDCDICGNPFSFVPARKHKRICSPECKRARALAKSREYRADGRYRDKPYYRSEKRKRLIEQRRCAVCGDLFWLTNYNPDTKTCGSICGGKYATRNIVRANVSTVCGHCGEAFTLRRPREPQTFCSRRCRAASRKVYADRNEKKRAWYQREREKKRLEARPRQCTDCRLPLPGDVQWRLCLGCRERHALERRIARPVWSIVCLGCGELFQTARSRSLYCSSACSIPDQKRVARQARKARVRNVTVENVNPSVVFERDGWRCRLCGIDTPRHLRGTSEANAPEHDHVIPIAGGGEHSYANSQCLCRDCNWRKCDVPIRLMVLRQALLDAAAGIPAQQGVLARMRYSAQEINWRR